MKTLALHLQKGGVGKTSLAGSLGYELAKKGRTILLDLDPQGNLSSWMLREAPPQELAAVLFGKVEAKDAIVATATKDLDILATFGLDGELKLFGENQLASEPFIFCDLVEELARLGYAYAVMDLSPGMGRLERSALIAADEVVTPMTPENFSLDGIEIFAAELAKTTKAMRRGPTHRRIVVNAFDARIAQHQAIKSQAWELQGFELFSLPVDPCFRKAQAEGVPIQALPKATAPKAETTAELQRLGEAVCR